LLFRLFFVANGGGACDDYFKILHLKTLSVAEIMQGVASVMAGWLDQWMIELMNKRMNEYGAFVE